MSVVFRFVFFFFFQAEDGIRDLVRSRGLGDVYKRQQEMQEQPDILDVGWPSGRRGKGFLDLPFEDGKDLSLIHI